MARSNRNRKQYFEKSRSKKGADVNTAESTSWDDFLKSGYAEGEYLYVVKGAEKILSDTFEPGKKIESDRFDIALPWNLLLFQHEGKAANGGPKKFLSVFLVLPDAKSLQDADLPKADFTLTVVNRSDPAASIQKDSSHRFTAEQDDWGYAEFVKVATLQDAREQFMPDGNLHIQLTLRVEQPSVGARDDAELAVQHACTAAGQQGPAKQVHITKPKQEPHVAMANQGAVGYLQTLLQTLHSVPQFRNATHQLWVSDGRHADAAIPRTLKRLFGKLEQRSTPVSRKRPRGWVQGDSHIAQGVEELVLQLSDQLAEKAGSMDQQSVPCKASRLNIPVDITEGKDGIRVIADLPGVPKDAIILDIDKVNSSITISVAHSDDAQAIDAPGMAPVAQGTGGPAPAAAAGAAAVEDKIAPGVIDALVAEETQTLLQERVRRFGARTITFPKTANLSQAKAECEGGVLRVSIPKLVLPKPTRLAVL